MLQKQDKKQFEFIALMASLMSLVALAIDALLPALPIIGDAIGLQNENNSQLLITMIFLGLGVGQLFFGPISDTYGRKRIVYIGFIIFTIGSLICVFAKSLEIMVLGRIVQGIGLSSPRTVSVAMVRDKYEGDYMARIMSFVSIIFIIIPAIAPALGKYILDHYNWQAIFYFQLVFSVIVIIWFYFRQEETLKVADRIPFSLKTFINGLKEILKEKSVMSFTIISGLISGSFMIFLSTSQQIFQSQYDLTDEFPLIFAGFALCVGGSTFINGTLVLKYGMEKLIKYGLLLFCLNPLLYLLLFYNKENPEVTILIIFFVIQFISIGFLFGNLKAITMQPIGHIAGIGAAITGFIATMMAVPLSTFVGSFINTTVIPVFMGFFIFGIFALTIYFYLKKTTSNVD